MSDLLYRNISKDLGDGAAFDRFSLAIEAGEFVALVGQNGCGKAELIRMAEGYGGSYEGEVLIADRRITHRTRGHHMASLLNDVPLIGTPRTELSKVLRDQGMDKNTIAKRVDEAAALTGMADKLDVRYSRLDAEGRLRAGMARAYAAGARAALMLDPFADVDARMAARMRIAVKEFRTKTDMAFLMSTNSSASALPMATRIVVMDKGRIVQSDTTQNIYDFPADRFVAEYFGNAQINMIPATLTRVGDEVHALFGDTRILIPAGKLAKLVSRDYIGKRVLLGVRPENLHYEQAFISLSPESAFDAKVCHIELMGSETYLHLKLNGVEGYITARVDPRCVAIVGHPLMLAIDANRIHLFDIETEKTILSKL